MADERRRSIKPISANSTSARTGIVNAETAFAKALFSFFGTGAAAALARAALEV